MKRHPFLLTISRQHHMPLRVSEHLLRHPEEDGEAALLKEKDSLLSHFDLEEESLADLWAKLPPDLGPALKRRFLDDHEYFRGHFDKLGDRAEAEAFARRLIDHVRFEERELFPALQEHCLPPAP